MSRTVNPYYNLGYWLLLYVPLIAAGFYVTYFSVIHKPQATIIHLHFILMALWLAMAIAQPFFIKYKMLHRHRITGRISYVLFPLVWLSGYAMMRFGYFNYIDPLAAMQENGLPVYSRQQLLYEGADYILLPFVYVCWMPLFYGLGIIHRKKMHPHSRYMLAAILTITGPVVDRIFFILLGINAVAGIPAEYISFLLVDLLLLFLLLKDKQAGLNLRPLTICLLLYVGLQLFYYFARGTGWWQSLATFVVQPGI